MYTRTTEREQQQPDEVVFDYKPTTNESTDLDVGREISPLQLIDS